MLWDLTWHSVCYHFDSSSKLNPSACDFKSEKFRKETMMLLWSYVNTTLKNTWHNFEDTVIVSYLSWVTSPWVYVVSPYGWKKQGDFIENRNDMTSFARWYYFFFNVIKLHSKWNHLILNKLLHFEAKWYHFHYVKVDDRSISTVIITWTRKTVGDINRCVCMIVNLFIDVYHSDQFRNYEGTKVSDDFNKTIQMKKSSKFYSMMTVQRFEQQTDEITVIAPFYTVIINQNSDCFFFFFLEEIISVSSFIQNYYCLIYNDISNSQ